MVITTAWRDQLRAVADERKIEILSRFFKTGEGEYGYGDRFIGLTVPLNRSISRRYHDADMEAIADMLADEIHEFRLAALLALVRRYETHKDENERKRIAEFYLSHTARINNWDLVDLSAPQIAGHYCMHNGHDDILRQLCRDSDLWRRRIGIVATLKYIRNHRTELTAELAETLLDDREPLMHKATGWMLREAGKRDIHVLTGFLDRHAATMPRTMLRYSIERLDDRLRKHYMALGRPSSKKSGI